MTFLRFDVNFISHIFENTLIIFNMKLAESFKSLHISKITLLNTITLTIIVILLSYCRKIDKSENLTTKDPISEETVP